MEMFLMALCMSMFGLAVAAIAFGAATRPESPSSAVQPELRPTKAVGAARFFADRAVPPAVQQQPLLPTEVLLAQIENHVRLEQAAAESFLEAPSHAQLHTKTTSAFVN
jgi:hypothetical protein